MPLRLLFDALFRALGPLAVSLLLALPGWGQSLFSGSFGPAQPLSIAPAAPLIEARALALADRDGLASRRAMRADRVGPSRGLWAPYRPPSKRVLRRQAKALLTAPPRDFSAQTDLMCIAVSIYHEARSQPRSGQAAVASVILTRAQRRDRWGATPCEVVIPVQFSYLTPQRGFAPIRDRRAWALAVQIAADALRRGPDPRLRGADHYHATYVNPPWNQAMDLIGRIDDHLFWRSRPRPAHPS